MPSPARAPRVVIIGSGLGGICMGIQLKKTGIHSFTILEKADRLGGTWRDNGHPGAACDSPSFVYCFSFEQEIRDSPSSPTWPERSPGRRRAAMPGRVVCHGARFNRAARVAPAPGEDAGRKQP